MPSQSTSPARAPAARSLLSVTLSRTECETVVVTPRGEADLSSSLDLRGALFDACTEGVRHVIVDLDQVTFMDASTLGVLVDARRRILMTGGSLELRCHTPLGRTLLTISGLGQLCNDEG